MKRALRHLKGTTPTGLLYSDNVEDGDQLIAFIDADHARDMDKEFSTQGSIVHLAGAPKYRKSVNQMFVAGSTLQSENVAVYETYLMILHLKRLLTTIRGEQSEAAVIF